MKTFMLFFKVDTRLKPIIHNNLHFRQYQKYIYIYCSKTMSLINQNTLNVFFLNIYNFDKYCECKNILKNMQQCRELYV